jgi:hypothetical protein
MRLNIEQRERRENHANAATLEGSDEARAAQGAYLEALKMPLERVQ